MYLLVVHNRFWVWDFTPDLTKLFPFPSVLPSINILVSSFPFPPSSFPIPSLADSRISFSTSPPTRW